VAKTPPSNAINVIRGSDDSRRPGLRWPDECRNHLCGIAECDPNIDVAQFLPNKGPSLRVNFENFSVGRGDLEVRRFGEIGLNVRSVPANNVYGFASPTVSTTGVRGPSQTDFQLIPATATSHLAVADRPTACVAVLHRSRFASSAAQAAVLM